MGRPTDFAACVGMMLIAAASSTVALGLVVGGATMGRPYLFAVAAPFATLAIVAWIRAVNS